MAYLNHAGKKECRRNHTVTIYALLIAKSLILAVVALAPLSSEERITVSKGLFLFGLGLVFFTSLFNFINFVALKTSTGQKLKKRFHLSVYDILDISNKIVSSVQAALSCIAGTVVCLYSCTRSFLHTSHFASEAYAWFGASYFFYDIWSMYKVHASMTCQAKENGNACVKSNSEISKFGRYVKDQPIIIFHHLFIGSFGFLVIVYLRGGLGDCIFGYVYLMELSTPFVSVRGMLSRMGLKTSRLYVINGVLMLITFFFCRVVMFPYVCYLHAHVTNMKYFEAIASLPRGCKIGIIILMLPQVYWFWLMVKGAAKVFFTPKPVVSIMARKRRSANHNHS